MLWREASRREHATWADARSDVSEAHLRPGRIAQRGRQPEVKSLTRLPKSEWPSTGGNRPRSGLALKTLAPA